MPNDLTARQTVGVAYVVCAGMFVLCFVGCAYFLFGQVKVGATSCGSVVAPKTVTVETDLSLAVELPSEKDCSSARGGYVGWAVASGVVGVGSGWLAVKFSRVLQRKKPPTGAGGT